MVSTMAKFAKSSLVQRMHTGPYTISTDGSNDADAKQFPLVVRTVNMKSDNDLVIGEAARAFLSDREGNQLRDSHVSEFFKDVRKYFTTLVQYLLERLPLSSDVLRHAEVADVKLQQSTEVSSLDFFLRRFPCLLGSATHDAVKEQFCLFQTTDVSNCIKEREDHTWFAIGQLRDPDSGDLLFRDLANAVLGILTIPHGSAHCERVFSCVRKNKSPQRSSLSSSTMESLLVLKTLPTEPVDSVLSLSKEDLQELRSAYYRSHTQ